jgi:ribosomal protein L40E
MGNECRLIGAADAHGRQGCRPCHEHEARKKADEKKGWAHVDYLTDG